MKPRTLIAPILLAASLATATLATAQQPPQPISAPHGLQLTEAQQDKLFTLHHAAEPARRERDKAIHRAHEALRAMADSGKFDDAKAAALAQTIGQAATADALDHAREQAQFLALLTPEQRATMQNDRAQHGPQHGPAERP
ncbi:MAG: Spy/CpxP family protein refolding chaperone [Pseudomonadota bacterium]|nr:Spy/CpxP family protein refolding chaperone [Pseudomonadota bacterium]